MSESAVCLWPGGDCILIFQHLNCAVHMTTCLHMYFASKMSQVLGSELRQLMLSSVLFSFTPGHGLLRLLHPDKFTVALKILTYPHLPPGGSDSVDSESSSDHLSHHLFVCLMTGDWLDQSLLMSKCARSREFKALLVTLDYLYFKKKNQKQKFKKITRLAL